LFGDASRIKNANETKILSYIKDRMRSVFAGISNFAILRNSMGYPMFALLMGVTNPSPRAVSSALRISNHLISNLNHGCHEPLHYRMDGSHLESRDGL
jgi:hypothetical protein